MGLDAVELVMTVEEKFGISIPDEEASNALTVGDLKRLVQAKLDIADADGCLTQRAFHIIRKHAITEFQVDRRKFSPDTALETVIPMQNRRENWESFQAVLGVAALPQLARPLGVKLMITTAVVFTALVLGWYGAVFTGHVGLWILIAVIGACLVGMGAAHLTIPMKTEFERGYDKVRDLARFLVAKYPQTVGKPRTATWTQEEISCLLREIIMDQLGVSEFDDNSRFVQDLHID